MDFFISIKSLDFDNIRKNNKNLQLVLKMKMYKLFVFDS